MKHGHQFRNFPELREGLRQDGWFTPDTYCNEFAEITNLSAVYLLLLVESHSYKEALVTYVGMSTKLLQRLTGHNILAEIDAPGYWAMRWFKPTPARALRAVESSYITKFDPPWNIIGRPRGVALQ